MVNVVNLAMEVSKSEQEVAPNRRQQMVELIVLVTWNRSKNVKLMLVQLMVVFLHGPITVNVQSAVEEEAKIVKEVAPTHTLSMEVKHVKVKPKKQESVTLLVVQLTVHGLLGKNSVSAHRVSVQDSRKELDPALNPVLKMVARTV